VKLFPRTRAPRKKRVLHKRARPTFADSRLLRIGEGGLPASTALYVRFFAAFPQSIPASAALLDHDVQVELLFAKRRLFPLSGRSAAGEFHPPGVFASKVNT